MSSNFFLTEILKNNFLNIFLAISFFFLSFKLLPFLQKKIVKKIRKIAKKTKTKIDDLALSILANIKKSFFLVISIFLAAQFLHLPENIKKYIKIFFLAFLLFEVAKAFNTITSFGIKKIARQNKDSSSGILFLGKIARILIWFIAGIFLLQNIGVNVSSLITGFGIGGIAVALAVQSILGDFFSSFSILFDKPFKIGDYITIDGYRGTVKKIGIKTTRLESLTGEEIIIANKDLTGSRILNFKRMKKRRNSFSIGVEYDTSLKKLKKIPSLIKEAGKNIKDLEIDRVHFTEFGDFSLNFEIVFWVLHRDFSKFRDLQQELNFNIVKLFEKEKITFAFPTQTLIVSQEK